MSVRRLVLIRHAKTGDGLADIERRLTDRGHLDAAAIGTWLNQLALAPDRVVVSPARRARQTWEEAAAALIDSPTPIIDERIYGNSVDELLDVIRDAPDDVRTLVLVGHNPSMAELAYAFDDGSGPSEIAAELASGFPTSGIAVFALATPYREVRLHRAALTHFAAPRG
jgi:phosphohistidine phosphatase